MPIFTARYRSLCNRCYQYIEVGQQMSWTRKGTNGKSVKYHISCPSNASSVPDTHDAEAQAIRDNINRMDAEMNPQSTIAQAVAVEPVEPDNLASAIADAINPLLKPSMDADAVKAIVDERVKTTEDAMLKLLAEQSKPRELTVTIVRDNEAVTRAIGTVHKQFDMLLKLCAAHSNGKVPINIWITGPAGSGKTHAAAKVAEALGIPFYFCGAIAEPYSLIGYMDAHGKVVRTPFREAYENGGLFLQDEIDGSNANALLSFNAALANGHCAFPDAVVPRHKDCIIIAAANTFGLGGTNDYVGRVKLDAASLSRYVFLDWPYDEEMEKALVSNQDWANRVINLRHKVKSLGLKILVTPRATYTGDVLLAAGIPQKQVEEMVIKQGMTQEQWNQIGGF